MYEMNLQCDEISHNIFNSKLNIRIIFKNIPEFHQIFQKKSTHTFTNIHYVPAYPLVHSTVPRPT